MDCQVFIGLSEIFEILRAICILGRGHYETYSERRTENQSDDSIATYVYALSALKRLHQIIPPAAPPYTRVQIASRIAGVYVGLSLWIGRRRAKTLGLEVCV